MCVIIQFQDNKPEEISSKLLKDAEEHNKHGGGIAWIDGDVVRWEKGMHVTTKYIEKLIKKENIKQPFLVHFRIATHGTIDTPLCHPFALSPESDDLASSGSDPLGVLFHNGVWSEYRDVALKTVIERGIEVPEGDISDSRIMAWLVRHLGMSYLGLIDEKIAVLTPKGLMEYGRGWTTVKNVRCSNDNFDHSWGGYNSGNGYYKTSYNSNNSKKDKEEKCVTLVSREDAQDFRSKIVSTAREIDLEAENIRRRSHGKQPLSMSDFEVLYDSGEDFTAWENESNSDEYTEKLKKMKKKLRKMGYTSDDEAFDEDLGTGYIDGAGVFHPYSEDIY